jgi:hypothetical protein
VEDGAYLYYDTNKEVWIHAGMVANQAFIEHGNEHFKCSKKPTTSSDFYSSYPSRDAPTAKCKARKGYFENLEQRIALGYGLQQPVSDLVQIFQLHLKNIFPFKMDVVSIPPEYLCPYFNRTGSFCEWTVPNEFWHSPQKMDSPPI